MGVTRVRIAVIIALGGAIGAYIGLGGAGVLAESIALRLLAAVGIGLGVIVLEMVGWKLVEVTDLVGARFRTPTAQSVARIVSYLLLAGLLIAVLWALDAVLSGRAT